MRPSRPLRARILPLFLASAFFMAGCDDDLGPPSWIAFTDTVDVFSLDRVEYLGLPAGYDAVNGTSVVVEAIPGPQSNFGWDFVLTEKDGRLHLTPPGAFKGLEVSAGIAVVEGSTFEDLAEAPRDTTQYRRTAGVPVEVGDLYVVRTRRYGSLGCVSYGKFEVLEADEEEGALRFRVIRNPQCNDRALIPPK